MTTALTTCVMQLTWQYLTANTWNKNKVWNTDAWRKILTYPNMPPKQPGICSSWKNFFVGTVQENSILLKTVSHVKVPRKWQESKKKMTLWKPMTLHCLYRLTYETSSNLFWRRFIALVRSSFIACSLTICLLASSSDVSVFLFSCSTVFSLQHKDLQLQWLNLSLSDVQCRILSLLLSFTFS